MKKFFIIDGNSLANRAFYAMPYLTNRKRQPSGAIFGFANLLIRLIEREKPDQIAVAFDHSRETFRRKIYQQYKGTRHETPPDLIAQFPEIKKMLSVMQIATFELDGFEADDLIGTLAANSDMQNILISGDRDLLQLIDENCEVWLTKKGVNELDRIDEAELFARYGISPAGVVDLKALMGDGSDNIPGVAGVGEKTALSLLHQFQTLDGVYENLDQVKSSLRDKLLAGKESAQMSKVLATIKTDCPIQMKDCSLKFPFSQEVFDFFTEWNFSSITSKTALFMEGVKENKKEVNRVCVESLQNLEPLKHAKDFFCYNFDLLEFAIDGDVVFYVKKEYDLFSIPPDLNSILKELKCVFEDEKIVKITTNSKRDIRILQNLGITLRNFFDISIAQYVLFAGLSKTDFVPVENYISERKSLLEQMKTREVEFVYDKIEIPLVQVLVSMENEGFKIDEETLSILSQNYKQDLDELSERIYSLAGEQFNINSPKQVATILYDKLGLKSFDRKNSTKFAVLDEMRWQHEIVDLIIEHRKLSKLVSTYINVYENICKTSGNVVHTVFNQTLATTGRLSSSEPNMQNIPTRDEQGRNMRKIFISKYENGQIISADYNQIELRLLANLSKEQSLIDAYNNGIDIHTKTASEIFGVPVEEVTREQRRDAKAVNFGIIYGISDYGLSQNIKTSQRKAKEYIENFYQRYPNVKKFMDDNVAFAKENGFVRSFYGRIRHLPELSSSNYAQRKFSERAAMNMPLQGTASDVIKLAMIQVFKQLEGMKSHLILQIHDELIIDAPAEEAEKVKQILKDCMEGVANFEVPLVVSVNSGKNLFECK